jgi:L-lactate dehydrogenase complex protein LldG
MTEARDEVLDRIRAALGAASARVEIPRAYRRAHAADEDAATVVARFCERAADYRATVHRVDAAGLPGVVSALLGGARVLVSAQPPCDVRGLHTIVDDPPLAARELDVADAVLTGCALAVAETGTIVLDGTGCCGRRALTLVPDHHVCVVRAAQIVGDVPGAICALEHRNAMRRPITLISGPSATSDIELERVEGVHGPRELDVIVVS